MINTQRNIKEIGFPVFSGFFTMGVPKIWLFFSNSLRYVRPVFLYTYPQIIYNKIRRHIEKKLLFVIFLIRIKV